MPTLTLKLSVPVDAARAKALAAALTELTATLLGKRRDVTAVLIESLPDGRWFVGSGPATRPTVLLAIEVTAGTNSADEKARFVEAAFAELERQLALEHGLQPASYVQVRELGATDWGYGGLTQARRRTASVRKEGAAMA
jgi:4-oxalocrotonate tautomerase